MITVHGLRNCDKTRAALRALGPGGALLHDLRENPLPVEVLKDWMKRLGPGLVNRSSTTWRSLGSDDQAADPLDLLVRFPTLLKRPVIAEGDRLTMGWTRAVQDEWSA